MLWVDDTKLESNVKSIDTVSEALVGSDIFDVFLVPCLLIFLFGWFFGGWVVFCVDFNLVKCNIINVSLGSLKTRKLQEN